jgi:small subunit ribosomal protein S7
LELILKNFLYIIKKKKYNKFRILLKKTLFILFKLKYCSKAHPLKVFTNKLFLFYIKSGYNLNSFNNILSLKKNIRYKIKTKNDALFKKFVGLITKKGHKIRAKKIFLNVLLNVKKELKVPTNIVLLKMFIFLKTSVESKKIRVRRTFHLVPFPINKNRKTFLIAKWVLFALKTRNNKTVVEKLSLEIIKLLKNLKTGAKKNKRYNVIKSLQNKSNLHFRW